MKYEKNKYIIKDELLKIENDWDSVLEVGCQFRCDKKIYTE